MIAECNCGLFAGVSEYPLLRKERWLPGAINGAEHLRQYFRSANPTGYWRALLGNVERLDLIEEIDELSRRVPEGEAGVIYFSGHAMQAVNTGLLLACSDFRPRYAADSGLHLRRMFDLLRGRPGRFAIILDACRERLRQTPPDDIPENTAVLYACGIGETTFENSAGGVLTRALLGALAALGDGLRNWSLRPLHVLADEVRQASIEMNHPAVPLPELCGSHDAIHFRVQAQPHRAQGAEREPEPPRCSLRTMEFPNGKSLNAFALAVTQDIERWIECIVKIPVAKENAGDFQIDVDAGLLHLHLPRQQQFTSMFLALLISRYSDRLDSVQFIWPYESNVDAFLGVGALLGDATRLNRAWRPKRGQFTWEQAVVRSAAMANGPRVVREQSSGRLEIRVTSGTTIAEIRAVPDDKSLKSLAGLSSVAIALGERLVYSKLARKESK